MVGQQFGLGVAGLSFTGLPRDPSYSCGHLQLDQGRVAKSSLTHKSRSWCWPSAETALLSSMWPCIPCGRDWASSQGALRAVLPRRTSRKPRPPGSSAWTHTMSLPLCPIVTACHEASPCSWGGDATTYGTSGNAALQRRAHPQAGGCVAIFGS